EFGIVLDQIQRRRRAVDTHHLTGTEGRRLHTPAADIAVQIQYPLAGDIGRQARPVHAVVIEPAGLLDRKSTRLNSSHVKISYAATAVSSPSLHDALPI